MQSNSKNGAGNSSPNQTVFLNTKKEKGKIKKSGQRVVWSHEENLVLWEAYIRSKILSARTGRGYTFLLKEIWDGKDIGVRSQASLVLHVGRIKSGLYLSDNERKEVERIVREEMSVVRQVRSEEGGEEDVKGDEQGEVGDEEDKSAGEVEDVEEVMAEDIDKGDEFKLDNVGSEGSTEDVDFGQLDMETEEDDVDLVDVGESSESEEKVERRDVIGFPCIVNVVLEKEEVWKVGKDVRTFTKEEKLILTKFKLLVLKEEKLVIPSLKTVDKKQLKEKVLQIKGLMHNIIKDGMSITEVNRVLLVGGFLVAEGLGKVSKAEGKKNKTKGKPYWMRRVEKNISEWRKDLGRVEELRRGTVLKQGVMSRLNNKYDLVEKGCLSCLHCLKIRSKQGQ